MLALVPLLGLFALATAEGGIDGQVSKAWDQLTDPNAQTPANTPDRLTATSSVRARYWREALDIHATEPWLGSGAGAYATVRSRFRDDALFVRHAHGYGVQTLADLGWIGLIVSLLAAAAWLLSAARATGVRRADRGLPYDAERIGMLTLVVVALVFAAHSLIDWTWFVPANAGVAVLCAGWVAGRGPLRVRLEHPEGPPGPEALTWPHASRLARLGQRMPPLRALAVVGVIAIALVASWTALQPVRAVHAGDAAFDRLDQGQPDAAAEEARVATERNPLSVDPAVRARGDRGGARAHAGGRGRARARRRPAAGEPRGVAPARAAAAVVPQRPEGRAERLPGRVLPRSEGPGLDLGRDRGQPRRGYGRRAHAVRPARTRTSSNPACSSVVASERRV